MQSPEQFVLIPGNYHVFDRFVVRASSATRLHGRMAAIKYELDIVKVDQPDLLVFNRNLA